MGSNQSSTEQEPIDEHGILVVNPSPNQDQSDQRISLPPRVPPILSIEGHAIDLKRHKATYQLDPQPWIDVVSMINEFAISRSELVTTRQNHLQEKIIRMDAHIQKFTESYVNDKHKALARMNDDCRKVDEMNKLLDKCTIQSELCVGMLNKLNFLLPAGHKLEDLEA